MIDEEVLERVARVLRAHSLRILGYPNAMPEDGDCEGLDFVEAKLVLQTLRELGYRKQPEGKPPLLSDKEITEIVEGIKNQTHIDSEGLICPDIEMGIADAQRDLDIKYYEG